MKIRVTRAAKRPGPLHVSGEAGALVRQAEVKKWKAEKARLDAKKAALKAREEYKHELTRYKHEKSRVRKAGRALAKLRGTQWVLKRILA
jgi:hypothetical protein